MSFIEWLDDLSWAVGWIVLTGCLIGWIGWIMLLKKGMRQQLQNVMREEK